MLYKNLTKRRLHKGIICLESSKDNKNRRVFQIIFRKQGNKKTKKEYIGFSIPYGSEQHISLNVVRVAFLLKMDVPMSVAAKYLVAKYISNCHLSLT